jgi:NADPH:quinone reductase-like Zn-dependent oxidoreductase
VEVVVDAALVHPSGWSGGRSIAGCGGPFVGHIGHRRVMGAERSGVCQERVTAASSELAAVTHLEAPDDHLLLAAACAPRAAMAAAFAVGAAAERVVVLGASGPTGCLLGGMLRAAGVEATAVSGSQAAGVSGALAACGFASVVVREPIGIALGQFACDALIDLVPGGTPAAREWAMESGAPLLRFRSSLVESQVPCRRRAGLTELDSWYETLRDTDRSCRSFEDALDGMAAGELHVPVREVTLEDLADVAALFELRSVVGAVVLRPAKS